MDADLELDGLRHEWQTDVAAATDLADRVARAARRMQQFELTEIAIRMVFGGGSIACAARSRRSEVLGAGRRDLGVPDDRGGDVPVVATGRVDAPDHHDVGLSRPVDSALPAPARATLALAALYVAILSFNLWWIHAKSLRHAGTDALTFLTRRGVFWVWPVTAVLAVTAARQHRRRRRELQALTALEQAFQGNDDAAKELNSCQLRTSRGLRWKRRRPTGLKYGGT